MAGETRHETSDVAFIIMDRQGSVNVYNLVIPGRNLAVELMLARLPTGRNERLRTPEYDQDRNRLGAAGRERIAARDMGSQCAGGTDLRVKLKGNMVSVQSARVLANQHAERVFPDDPVGLGRIG